MKKNTIFLFIFIGFICAEVKTLSMRPFIEDPENHTYTRGGYLIIMGNSNFENLISNEAAYGDFLKLKRSQGYDVEVVTLSNIVPDGNVDDLRNWIQDYSDTNPLLEYVLLVGDVDGSAEIGTFRIPSYNEPEQDATDYPFTFFSDDEMYDPRFFIGRWSVSVTSEFVSIKKRTIDYQLISSSDDFSYLNRALLVAGSYKTESNAAPVPATSWPLTPYWTSLWIQDELEVKTDMEVDTALFHINNQVTTTIDIVNPWNEGIGIVNYRGWGNATGWTKPEFKLDDINSLTNSENLPVVFSFVCNTGDFGNETNNRCFGEKLTTNGSASDPEGAVAVIGPSDLDTDTRFNNVLCGAMWDEMLEKRIYELGPVLHSGKQAVAKEFEGLDIDSVNPPGTTMSIPKFYHHVYAILGDPSLSVWLGEPSQFNYELESEILTESFVNLIVKDKDGNLFQDVVGAILNSDGELIAKGISNENGELFIKFSSIAQNSQLELYLNAPQYFQTKINLTFESDNGSEFIETDYNFEIEEAEYTEYAVITSVDDSEDAPEYDWIEINEMGENLNLTDDSVTRIAIGFDFTYFGEVYDSLTVCSNGWVSFEPTNISHFWNFSIPFPMGPNALIAPFMDDLDDNVGTEPFDVYSYIDGDNKHIIQWDNLANGEDDEFCGTIDGCTRETFQLILTSNENDNGDILFQYKEINDIDENGNYSTIGIESPDQNFGYQYQFRNIAYGTKLVENEMAILFTTNSSDSFLDSKNIIIPSEVTLNQNYPNPFNPSTQIEFELTQSEMVSLNIYNLNGMLVSTLLNQKFLNIGKHNYTLDASNLPSGLYFYKLQTSAGILSKKMILLK